MDPIVFEVVNENRRRTNREKIRRKILREKANVLDLSETMFMNSFRVNKEAFLYIMKEIEPYIPSSSIPAIIQLAATLRFLAEGSYQRSIGQDIDINFGRSTTSKVLSRILNILEKKLCKKWIKLSMSEGEKQESKSFFFENFGIPGIIGCVDGSHIKILKPRREANLYYNRDGYFSINAMIVCDHKMRIRGIDATHQGSSHDALIWYIGDARNFFLQNFENGERDSWLLGDADFALEPFVMTPYKFAQPGTFQANFNKKHSSARNIIERTIGNLKCRFRCLLNTLYYEPKKVVQIVNVCCCIHNICNKFNLQMEDLNIQNENIEEHIMENEKYEEHLEEAQLIRDGIAQSLN